MSYFTGPRIEPNGPEGADEWQDRHKRECYARWLLAKYRRGEKTKEQVEAWLKAQPDEQQLRDVMRAERGR